jgi:surfactin synthase thioesterase subunit
VNSGDRVGGCLPVQLFVSGRQAPQLLSPLPPIHALSDKEFFTELQRRYGGTNVLAKDGTAGVAVAFIAR